MIIEAERPPVGADSAPARANRSAVEYFAAAIALIIPIAFVTTLDSNAWSARTAILLIVVGVGLPLLLRQTRGPQPFAARAAVAFLMIGAVSAALSQNHTTALFGLYNQGTGLLFIACLASIWAIGRAIRPKARPLLESALLVGILINVAIALLGSVVDLTRLSPDLLDGTGRSSGLTGNPVYLAALLVLGLTLLVPRFAARPAVWAVSAAAVAAATQLSGSRTALIVMAGIVAWAARRHGVKIGAMLALVVFLGLAAGTFMGTSAKTNATARAGELNDWKTRPATWLSARHAIARHPLLGVGPGQFRAAVSAYRPVAVARAEGPDRLFTDAHNIVVEYATTTGLLGLGALLVWLFAAVRSARGWLLVGALGVLAIHLLEPQWVATTPLAFLALGASGSCGIERDAGRRVRWLIPTTCLAVTMATATVFLMGDYALAQASLDLNAKPAEQANRLLPAWPLTATLLARVWIFRGITNRHNEADYQRSRPWRVVAVQRDNSDPTLWNNLAEFDESEGRVNDAQTEYLTALRFNRTSVRAMNGLARLARSRCDPHDETRWRQRALAISPVVANPVAGPGSSKDAPPVCAGGARG